MIVKLLAETENLTAGLAKFDAGKAKCFLDRDRQRLLAVIEASFGTFACFNQSIRRIFKGQLIKDRRPTSTGLHEVKIVDK